MEQGALWRQKAADLFPDLRAELEETDPDDGQMENIYFFFFELLPRCFEATGAGDNDCHPPFLLKFPACWNGV